MAWNPAEPWLDAWAAATAWWTQGGQALADANVRVLMELADGMMRRFGGQPVELVLGGTRVEALLESVRLRRDGDRYTARAELTNAVWDGLRVDELLVVADSVAVAPGAPPRVTLTDVELSGSTPLSALVAWIEPHVEGWSLAVDADGLVVAQGPRPGVRFVVEPEVEDHRLHAELRALRWGRRRVPLPSWLRLVHTVALPALPRGLTVADARRRGQTMDFRLRLPLLVERFDPARVRDAVFSGGPVPLAPPR